MRSWVFRHRHGLRALYGLPPEARMAKLMASAAPAAPAQGGAEPGLKQAEEQPHPQDPGLLKPFGRRAS